MKKLLLLLLITTASFSQTIYRGNINENGMPIPGATICVLGTSRCTQSDFDGNYVIEATSGEQLQISMVGMKNKIIRVGNSNLTKNDGRVVQIISSDYLEKLKKPSDSVKKSKSSGYFDLNLLPNLERQEIVKIIRQPDGFYKTKNKYQLHKAAFEINQEYIVSTPFRLPRYQQFFAQGRSLNGELTYQSPETNEIFSWGPNVNTLQYSQNSSQYYPQGDIVNRFSATAAPLTRYNPNNFYQDGEESKTVFNAQIESPKGNYLKVNFAYKTGNIVVPDTRNNEISTSLKYFRNTSENSKIEGSLSFNNFENNFSNANFGMNKVFFANSVTPVHFDNKWASALENGQQRSYAATENNPYFLIHNNLDTNKSKTYSFNFNHVYSKNKISNTFNTVFQSSEIKNTNGQSFYAAGITEPNFNKRTEDFKSASVSDIYKYTFSYRAFIESKVDFRFQKRALARHYFSGYSTINNFPYQSDIQSIMDISQQRFEVLTNINGSYIFRDIFSYYDELVLKASSNLNYSSTVKSNFLPGYFVSAELNRLFNDKLSIKIGHGHTENEPLLQNNNLNFNSLFYQVNEFKQLQNNHELITQKNAVATTEDMSSIDLNFRLNYRWNLSFNYYHKKIENLYVPVLFSNTAEWSPEVNYKQSGIEFGVDRNIYSGKSFTYGFNLNFTYYRNKVTALENSQTRIPFAGFADVNKNYIVGQPLGVIVGSSYLRDANQNMIIDADGFPIKNPEPQILGDPNPDFVVGFSNTVRYKRFTFDFVFDWSQGGKIWNGTQQTLNYYGKSDLTGEQRYVANYIFDGVTAAGAVNAKAVSFYDVNLPVEQNRWARYGIDGVAEDAIEDATYLRLSTISLSYSKDFRDYNDICSFKISLFVNNAFVIAKSKSAFGNNSMFSSIETNGLDYFNSPMMRSFGTSLTIKF
ncbi:carboxypeptidase-like regulatory domain-containing protein [Flavobacterium phragmitis]|uniref:CarboxypepD_reg-like domain-containing protein n=1 Tax=Flavobacterium phragmitis TaxID=739143 RepID=A0A1I1MFD6_9FLAO|nr:carboxypeptidase-like regulatory domain-containing protein [Flavobacterium phragmitis]SFC83885.1 CarboxypepD_reg-like domain-containing protein [Flavobacterium phragmitis]